MKANIKTIPLTQLLRVGILLKCLYDMSIAESIHRAYTDKFPITIEEITRDFNKQDWYVYWPKKIREYLKEDCNRHVDEEPEDLYQIGLHIIETIELILDCSEKEDLIVIYGKFDA